MIAVACEAGIYKVAEHFRAKKGHAADCRLEGSEELTKRGDVVDTVMTRSWAGKAPSNLRFRKKRRQRVEPGLESGGEISEDSHVRRGKAETVSGEHGRNVTLLQPVAESYCSNLDSRDDELTIEGYPPGTYGTLFEELRNTGEDVRWPRKVLFAPIRFTQANLKSHPFVLYLNREIRFNQDSSFKRRVSANIQLTLDFSESNERVRNYYRKELENGINIQKGYWSRREGDRVYAFFLGEQNRKFPNRFVVKDHRKFCLLELSPDEIASL